MRIGGFEQAGQTLERYRPGMVKWQLERRKTCDDLFGSPVVTARWPDDGRSSPGSCWVSSLV